MKRILAMVICVALLATMAITGSIAYLQDTDSTINTMVVGNVDIDQIEQQRKADSTLVDFDNDKPLYPAVYGNGTNSDGVTGRGEAKKGTDGFWSNVAGAQDKIVSVKNTGKSEAYVRTWFAFEADANDKLEYIDINWNKEVTPVLYKDGEKSYVTIGTGDNANNYVVYCVTYPAPLAVGATSEKSLLQVHMKPEADNEYVAAFDETYDILVFTQAGQVENMSTDPKTALDFMFGAGHPWNDEDFKVETGRIIIRTAADLQALGGKTFTTDTKIVLANDIDMDGASMSNIVVRGDDAKLTFDGNGHTISNVNFDGASFDSNQSMRPFGLFYPWNNATLNVSNLTIKGATTNGTKEDDITYAGVIVPYTVASKITLDKVTVCNSTIENDKGDAAGLIGFAQDSTIILKNCKVVDCTITGEGTTKKTDRTYNSAVTGQKINKNAAFVSTATGNSTVTIENSCMNGTSYPDWFCNALPSSASITGSAKQVITIGTAADLKAFANFVNNGTKSYSGQTVMLTADIDLNNGTWTPIGRVKLATEGQSDDDNKYFQGTFDGNGHTIKNFKVEQGTNGGYSTAGLFGWIDAAGATIKNLTIDNATVKGCHYTGAIAGYFSGTMENCTVKNSSIVCTHKDNDDCGDKAGAVVGYVNRGSVSNCKAVDCTVTAGRDAGQVVGGCYNNAAIEVKNCTATNVVVSVADGCTGANIENKIVGRPQSATVTPAN